MLFGAVLRASLATAPRATPSFVAVLVAGSLLWVGTGLWVDARLRRSTSEPRWVAPLSVRIGVAVVVIAAPTLVWIAGSATSRFGAMACAGSLALVTVPFALLSADRVAGVGWALGSLALADWRRRRWQRLTVLSVDVGTTRIANADGEELRVTSEALLEVGEEAYGEIVAADDLRSPYRQGARGRLVAVETLEQRDARRQEMVTAMALLLASCGWLAVWASPVLGASLVRTVYVPFAPR